MRFVVRVIQPAVLEAARSFPAVVVTGRVAPARLQNAHVANSKRSMVFPGAGQLMFDNCSENPLDFTMEEVKSRARYSNAALLLL